MIHGTIYVLLNDPSGFICIENDLSLTICCEVLKLNSMSTKSHLPTRALIERLLRFRRTSKFRKFKQHRSIVLDHIVNCKLKGYILQKIQKIKNLKNKLSSTLTYFLCRRLCRNRCISRLDRFLCSHNAHTQPHTVHPVRTDCRAVAAHPCSDGSIDWYHQSIELPSNQPGRAARN